jgi:DNA-3-methyladenine glycosylase II
VKELSLHYPKARRHLARRDPILKQLIATIGKCTLKVNPNGFETLVRSIVSQQISTKAALAIYGRLCDGLARLSPAALVAASEETLRSAGLSEAKRRALRDLAEKMHTDVVPLKRIHKMDDEEVIETLVPVHGIGRWTAEMFLIFSLGRLDVLPVDDLGLRVGVQRFYGLAERPGRKQLVAIGETWRPYRSIATWYFWRSFGAVPQSTPPQKSAT